MKVQPIKIILIHSANCQYAEFDLSDSLHFVARNNYGKTSIINTLQFLYIDNQKDLDLGYTLDKSWKHYFPSLGSYVLFELNTLTGRKVFGLSATGLGGQPEKFLYSGSYKFEDFIEKKGDQSISKKPEKLFPRLSIKDISRKLDSKNHRDILRPFDQKKNPSGLGLIGDTRDYRLFKRLFRQLLQLKSITIKDLKTQIERVNHRVMEKDQVINVQREFNEPYSEIQRKQFVLGHLQSNQRNISELLQLSKNQIKLQGRLVSYSFKSQSLFVAEDKQLNESRQIFEDGIVKLRDEKLPEIKIEREEKQRASNTNNQKLGVINDKIEEYEKLEEECLQIVVELEKESLQNLLKNAEDFQAQLFTAKDENLTQLEGLLATKRDEEKKKQKQLDGIADTLFAEIKSLLDEKELRQLYQISNPELWTLFKESGFTLHNTERLQAFLKGSLKHVKDTVCELPGLTIQLSEIDSCALSEMGDPDYINNEIIEIKHNITQLEGKVTAVQEQKEIRQKLKKVQSKIKEIEKKLERYEQWYSNKEQYQQWKNDRDDFDQEIQKIQREIDSLDDKKLAINKKIDEDSGSITNLKKSVEELTSQKQWLERHPTDNNWTAIEIIYETPSFSELYEQYKNNYEALQKASIEIKTKIDNLRSVFRQLVGLHDQQALEFLQQELDSIPEQEKSINDEWKRIFTSFAAHCKGMIESVDAIDSYLADLNRLLSKEQISNLQSVKIKLEINQWHRHIHNIKEWKDHDMPLFGGVDERAIDKLQHAVKPLLEKVKVSIADLYDLKLLVTDVHGDEKTYDSLDLESNGTSITVKTIIFISMINEAMKGKQSLGDSIRIPFYVDEIDSLDDFNAKNIHDIAIKLGLIPIFASPKGSGICKRLYQLVDNKNGKLNAYQKNAKSNNLVLLKPTFERIS